VALARAGGQHDDAPPAGLSPRVDRLGLVRAGLALHAGPLVELGIPAGAIFVADLRGHERADQIGIGDRRGAKTTRARVPRAPGGERLGQGGIVGLRTADFQRAGHERDRDHGTSL
jgi:hypothetical protein